MKKFLEVLLAYLVILALPATLWAFICFVSPNYKDHNCSEVTLYKGEVLIPVRPIMCLELKTLEFLGEPL